MRPLNGSELCEVSGGDWEVGFDLRVVDFRISGDESLQEIVSSVGDYATAAYWAGRDAMADFFTWWDPAGYYSSGC